MQHNGLHRVLPYNLSSDTVTMSVDQLQDIVGLATLLGAAQATVDDVDQNYQGAYKNTEMAAALITRDKLSDDLDQLINGLDVNAEN